jgi:signal transduction histidine kinase
VASQVPALADLVRTCLDSGKGLSREVLEARRPEGETGHLGVALSPAPGGALVLMTDLTEIREVQAQARLRENLAAVGQLSAGIAHEFRNALGTILGWARMLDKHEDPRVRGPAREIVREIDSVRGTVDEFLLYARPPEPARADVDVEELLRACAGALPDLAVEIGGSFGLVVADEGLLRRAFGNLLQNAKDMGGEVGRPVSVRVTGRVVSSGRSLQIDVEDDGPGIPPERRAQVFLPFFTTRARGTGLGLALVQRTLVDAGGSIEAAEGPRGGALFRVRLPRKGPVTKRDSSSDAAEPQALPRPLSGT